MSGSSGAKRRRRRRHTSAVLRTPEQLREQHRRRRIGTSEALAGGAVTIICLALIALVWITTERAIDDQYRDTRQRAEASVSGLAASLAIQTQHEMLIIDQSLSVLQAAWNNDPDKFNLATWRANMPALTAVSDDLFIANDQRVVVQDILPAAVGEGIGSAYATFASGSLEPIQQTAPGRDNAMVVGELGEAGIQRQFLMYLVRPLARPNGWIIGASYRSKALSDVFSAAGLGREGLAALVDTHRGGIQTVAGVAALHPRLAIGGSAMYRDMVSRPDGGIWIGRTPIDDVARIIAFRHVPTRDLFVVVGVATQDAMAPAAAWAAGAHSIAAAATLLFLAIGATVLWELQHWRRIRRRQRELSQAQALLSSVQSELGGFRLRAMIDAEQRQAILDGIDEGAAVFDAEHRLMVWNPHFAALCGLPVDLLHEGMPVEELVRRQVAAGRFGEATGGGATGIGATGIAETGIAETGIGETGGGETGIEAEIDRRLALLRPESGVAEIAETGPDGAPRALRVMVTRDGGLVLVWRGTATAVMAVPPEPEAETRAEPDSITDPTAADPVEW